MAIQNVDNAELFVNREDNLSSVEDEFGPSFFIVLRNFALNSSALRPAQMQLLRDGVVPFLTDRGANFAEIYGMTDRSGKRQLNYKVSGDRMRAVKQALLQFGAPPKKINHAFNKAIGEDFFEFRHDAEPSSPVFLDGKKNGSLRVVVIGLSPAPLERPTRRFRATSAAEILDFCRKHVQKPGN